MQHSRTALFLMVFSSLLLTGLGGCSSTTNKKTLNTPREAKASLSQVHADLRKSMIDTVDYILSLDLPSDQESVSGKVVIRLQMNAVDKPLTIDFTEGEISRLLVNETPLEIQYNGFFLTIPKDVLRKGSNTVEVTFRQLYRNDGEGLHRFIDPEDKRVYLYSNFEPYFANRVFPVLDQPDLKATFKLHVRAPDNWQVVSTKRERRTVREGNHRWWYFPASEKISPYLFSIHAGPYKIWEDREFSIPLRLMTRQSQQHKMHANEWFRLTRAGLIFYQEYLDLPLPYSKYDQLIVPDFSHGGMENAAAITLHESLLSESLADEPGNPHRLYVAEVMFHEMAHMWFGNLVTMKWWDGLWMNESFADFMAYMTMVEGASLTDGWLYFSQLSKSDAYYEDQLTTTHPIAQTVATTEDAEASFDGITYGKGAASLQQLRKYLGADIFRQGMREYLHKHQEGNTTLQDFIMAMESASGESLDRWTKEWLVTSGVNAISAQYNCKNGILESISIHQFAAETGDNILREQSITLALMMVKNNQLVTSRNISTTYSGKKTKVALSGRHPCPALIYPNSDDQAYVLVRLNETAQQSAFEHQANAPLLRLMILNSLSNGLKTGQTSLTRYTDYIFKLIGSEQNALLRQAIGGSLAGAYHLSLIARPTDSESQKSLTRLADDIESFIWQQVDLTVDDTSQSWFDTWLQVAHSHEAVDRIARILDHKKEIKNFEIQQYQRWQMLFKLSEFAYPGTELRIRQELQQDKSADGLANALLARAAAPSIENKRYWLNILLDGEDSHTQSELDAIGAGLFPASQTSQSHFLAQEIIDGNKMIFNRSYAFQTMYAELLINECSQAGIDRLDNAIKRYKDSGVFFSNALHTTRQRTERCIRLSGSIR